MTQPSPSQWQAPNMLLPTPQDFGNTANMLDKMLRWLRIFNIVAGGFIIAATIIGFIAWPKLQLMKYSLDIFFQNQLQPLWWIIGGFYLILIVLTVAFYYLTILLINWCREYLSMLHGVALGGPLPQRTRLEALHTTFIKYIVASQWAMPVLGVIMMLFPMVFMPLMTSLDKHSSGLGTGEALLLSLIGLIPLAIVSVVNWLLLAALKRWLEAATGRMRGLNNGPLSPAAGVVGNWFIFVLVLLGFNILGAIGNLFSPFFLGASLVSLPKDEQLHISSGVIALIILAFLFTMLFALAQQVIQFLAIMYSRTFAQQSAALLDAGPRPAPTDLPMNSGNPFEKVARHP